MPEQDSPLVLDEVTAKPPPEPEFTPNRLAEQRARVERRTGEAAAVLPFDRKNPSGRTRGDAVLRPTNDERDRRIRTKRRDAAISGALLVGFLTLLLAPSSLVHIVGMMGVGALVGALARQLGDSEVSWAFSIGLAGVPMVWNYGSLAVILCVSLLCGVGWIAGFTRDANLK